MGLSAAIKRSLKTAQETVQTRARHGHTESQTFSFTEDGGEKVTFKITPKSGGRFAKATRV